MVAQPTALTFRPTTPNDGPAISQLLTETFGIPATHPSVDPALLHWKYWAERSDIPGPRSFVLARGANIIAHAAIVPSRCLIDEGELRIAHVVDWVRHPSALGAGTALMKRIGRTVDALIAIGGSADTLAVLPVLGFRVQDEAIGLARPLRPLRRLTAATHRSWRSLPQFMRSVAWMSSAPASRPTGWKSTPVMPHQLTESAVPLPTRRAGSPLIGRTVGQLRYLMACPIVRVKLYALECSAPRSLRGYVLLAFAPGQARIVDCWIESNDPADWRALAQVAVALARQDPDAAEIVTLTNDPVRLAAFRASGFHVRQRRLVQMLRTGSKPIPQAGVSVQLVDNDAFCYRSSGDEFWA